MEERKIQPLDFVRIKKGLEKNSNILTILQSERITMLEKKESVDFGEINVGIVCEIDKNEGVSVEWIGKSRLYNAWWKPECLEIVDSLPNLLAREMANHFGHGRDMINSFFPVK